MTKGPLHACPFYNIAKRFHNNPFLTFSSLAQAFCKSRSGPKHHGRPQKVFQGGYSQHFAYLCLVVGDATQNDVYRKQNVQRYGNSCIQCFLCKKTLK